VVLIVGTSRIQPVAHNIQPALYHRRLRVALSSYGTGTIIHRSLSHSRHPNKHAPVSSLFRVFPGFARTESAVVRRGLARLRVVPCLLANHFGIRRRGRKVL